jgi:hypothetical protein
VNRDSHYETIGETVQRFVQWLSGHGYFSYDPYDIWGTQVGRTTRAVYYRVPGLGVPLIAPILLIEIFGPGLRWLFLRKERYATADAQLALGYLNMFEVTSNQRYLDEAITLGEALIETSVPGYKGYCWGYPFDWQNSTALWLKDTPYITTVPYGFEAFLGLYQITQEARYSEAAKSVGRFVYYDLNNSPTARDAAAASYSPVDSTKVINASAYRAFVLFAAASELGERQYLDKARKNLNFVLESQRPDGSWLYAVDNPQEAFIDHFHTCFVLKNLFKINHVLNEDRIRDAVRAGYGYYQANLFYKDGLPKSFAVEPRRQISRLDMYDVAEAITLGVLLRNEIPSAYEVALKLGVRAAREFQLPDGHFITRIYRGGIRHTLPFLRWAQAQMFLALTNLLVSEKERSGQSEDAAMVAALDERES